MWGSLCHELHSGLLLIRFGQGRSARTCACVAGAVCLPLLFCSQTATPHFNSFERSWHFSVKAVKHSAVQVFPVFHVSFDSLYLKSLGRFIDAASKCFITISNNQSIQLFPFCTHILLVKFVSSQYLKVFYKNDWNSLPMNQIVEWKTINCCQYLLVQ